MKIENTVKIMKEIHSDRAIIVKVGQFYYCYGKDAIVLSYLLGYVVRKTDISYNCGFPISAINKVMTKLEESKISYIIVNKADNYSVQDEQNFKSNNRYNDIYNKAHKYINIKNRINEIYNYLEENINEDNIKNKINRIEEILYEVW